MQCFNKSCLWRADSSLQPPAEVPFFGSVVLAEVTGILPLSPLTVLCCGVLLALEDCLPKDL